jgi:hypothetical protein
MQTLSAIGSIPVVREQDLPPELAAVLREILPPGGVAFLWREDATVPRVLAQDEPMRFDTSRAKLLPKAPAPAFDGARALWELSSWDGPPQVGRVARLTCVNLKGGAERARAFSDYIRDGGMRVSCRRGAEGDRFGVRTAGGAWVAGPRLINFAHEIDGAWRVEVLVRVEEYVKADLSDLQRVDVFDLGAEPAQFVHEEIEIHTCGICLGSGHVRGEVKTGTPMKHYFPTEPCGMCDGTGFVTERSHSMHPPEHDLGGEGGLA